MTLRLLSIWLILGSLAQAATVQQSGLALEASEQSCAVTKPATVFEPAARQAFYRLILTSVAATDRLTIDWLDPNGAVSVSVPYEQLPAAPSLCFVSQLPIAGFAPATQAGEWRVRVQINGVTLRETPFRIKADPQASGVIVRTASLREVSAAESELTLDGVGFLPDSLVNIAQYTASGGWAYLHHVFPATYSATRLTARLPALTAAEYFVILRNADGRLSPPARFVISRGGYRLPTPAGQSWILTQGPYGSFSHWGRSLHAYDIAPLNGTCVVAMRGGVVSAYDLGYGQTPNLRIFGNYITVAHDNGEFSHYAHLRAGSFRVRTGQVVEQGQALATVGTSGYSFGTHVHVHVTRAHWISTPSIPFQFEDLPSAARPGFRGTFTSRNESNYGNCNSSATPPVLLSGRPATAPAASTPTWTGQVGIADWWSKTTTVTRGARAFDIKLTWDGATHDLDLHLVSPSGRHFSPWDDTTGYAPAGLTKAFRIPNPEPGIWRVSVQGTRGAGEAIPFRVFQAAL
ncbi:MAG: peptidoglycan DD-metalloendopeptidase family protein [Bryobacteraceae bacterium]|nr:peptidoglycan DD-metalloendopeptidase family protein [Bryobacteraceae bacterium]